VVALANYPTPARSERDLIRVPAVAILKNYVSTPRKNNSFNAPNLRTVLVRDKFQCQYCACKLGLKSGTKDHVMPTSRGGTDTLNNVVAACKACNNKKADRTPSEAGMKLLSQPQHRAFRWRLVPVLVEVAP
jgi:5-methylcytosine-specific restriction endonuclease McrA